jgi:hypothetical protein
MLTALVVVIALSPCLIVLRLLALATWRARVRDQVLTRQAALTYAIHRELGAVAAPFVTKGLVGPWRVRMAFPLGRPAAVAAVLAIVNRELESMKVATRADYQILLTQRPDAGAATLRRGRSIAEASGRRRRGSVPTVARERRDQWTSMSTCTNESSTID